MQRNVIILFILVFSLSAQVHADFESATSAIGDSNPQLV